MDKELIGQEYTHVFYSVIGQHAGEKVEEIIGRKQNEVKKCSYSLWAVKIDKKSIEQVWHLNKKDKVYVMCRINEKAIDPVRKTKTPHYAVKAFGPQKFGLNEIIIPDAIKISYTKGKNTKLM